MMGTRVLATAGINGVIYSDDLGFTWTTGGFTGLQWISVSNNLVLGTDGIDIFASIDSGATFPISQPGPPGVDIRSLYASANDVYVGTDLSGIWWNTLFDVTSANGPQGQPQDEQTLTVYPNPVSTDQVFIDIPDGYYQESDKSIEITIYDATCKACLTSMIHQGPLPSSINLNISFLEAGIYFIRLNAGGGAPMKGRFIKQ